MSSRALTWNVSSPMAAFAARLFVSSVMASRCRHRATPRTSRGARARSPARRESSKSRANSRRRDSRPPRTTHWPPAARYCRALEAALGCAAQANAYLTPPSARGFAVHHDVHDVFVLQVFETKRWRWHEPVLQAPLKSQRWSAELGDLGEPVADEVLHPGDTLYLPRGWPHEAFTSDTESLHLTIGLHSPTRVDALRAALERCAADDSELRRTLAPNGSLPPDLLERVAARLTPEEVRRTARRRFVSSGARSSTAS